MAESKLTSDEMMAAILSYLGILFLVPLLAIKERNDFIKFHLGQGIVLFIAEIILYIAIMIVGWIPFIGWFIAILSWLIWIAILIVVIIAIVKAVAGERWEIPIISSFRSSIKL